MSKYAVNEITLFVSFCLRHKKKQKSQGQTNAPLFVRPTHKDSENNKVVLLLALVS